MKAVVTRVREASVEIAGEVHGAIDQGFLVLLGVGPEDDEETCDRLAEKVAHKGCVNRNDVIIRHNSERINA